MVQVGCTINYGRKALWNKRQKFAVGEFSSVNLRQDYLWKEENMWPMWGPAPSAVRRGQLDLLRQNSRTVRDLSASRVDYLAKVSENN
jgi:hypothetical protein